MKRAWIVFGFLIFVLSLINTRLFYWQVVASSRLRQEAAGQYYLQLALPAARGSLYASDGQPLVMNQRSYLVYASTPDISDKITFAAKVAGSLALDPSSLQNLISAPNRVWVPLAHKVEQAKVEELKKLAVTGLGFEKESKRYYPEGSASAQLVGFVGSDITGEDKGYFGLEGYYDRELRGKDGELALEKDVKGAPIIVGEARRIEPEDGRSLKLWIDRTIEHIASNRLLEGIQKYGAKEGTVTVLDPKTGGILAMASYPNYDPSAYQLYDRPLYKNPVVASSYEPGSTFKALVMAGAINDNVVQPSTTMVEAGPIQIGDYAIRTWNNEYHGEITMTKVLERSSNVGMVFVEQKLGKDKMLAIIHSFGFGELTGVDLEDETGPQLRPDNQWAQIDLATASFGQGIAVTPLQMVRAVGALANEGWLMEPHAVKSISDNSGKVVEIKPKKVRQVVSASAAHVIAQMMVAAVDNGEAKWAKPKGYRIAGKTGTAQVAVAGHYDDKKTIASFVGFAPANDPKFVMLVTLGEPTTSPWGSETAAPLFFTIAKDIFMYLGIPPEN